jgi:hypothetical protein
MTSAPPKPTTAAISSRPRSLRSSHRLAASRRARRTKRAGDKAPEVAAVSLGARIDVAGMGLEQLRSEEIAELLEHFPRRAFKEQFVEAIAAMCRKKPLAQVGQFTAEVGRSRIRDFACATITHVITGAPYSE